MNCQVMQRRLLEAPDPDRPPTDVQYHLAICLSCREWQRRLILIERHVQLLPVPSSGGPYALLRHFLGAPAASTTEDKGLKIDGSDLKTKGKDWPRAAVTWSWGFRSRTAKRWLTAGSAAAGIFLLFLGWWILAQRPQTGAPISRPRPDPLVARLLQRDLRLAEASTPKERMEMLAGLADDLHAETENLARSADEDDLEELARQYKKVVHDGLVGRARRLAAAERRQILPGIAERLDRSRQDAEALAQQVPSAAVALRMIAEAARNGHGQLRMLYQE